MKKIVVINASPRKEWNTGSLMREAAYRNTKLSWGC